MSSFSSALSNLSNAVDTHLLKSMTHNTETSMDNTEMLGKICLRHKPIWLTFWTDIETQPLIPESIESIESYGADLAHDLIETDVATPKPTQSTKEVGKMIDHGLNCECGVSVGNFRLDWWLRFLI
jgi:hypothetical protein